MKNKLESFKWTLPLCMATACSLALAQQEPPLTVSGSLATGVEYNSNVSVAELESASGQSDIAATVDAGLDMSWQATGQLTVSGGYSFSSQSYQDFDNFDLDMHMLYADISQDFERFSVGANHYYADAKLGGDDFLILNQSSVYVGRLINEQWFVRGALNISDKSFSGFAARDADTSGLSLDAFWFFNQGRSSLVLGYAYDDEDTRSQAFAYEADTLRIRYSNSFMLLGLESDLQLGLRTQQRDYKGITPSIGVPRDDNHYIADTSLKMNVQPWLAVTGKLERGNYQSRLPRADYSEERVSLNVEISF